MSMTLNRQHAIGLVFIAALFFLSTPVAQAQVSLTNTYTQNFNTLLNTGNNNPWTDNSTIFGWYSTRTTYQASDGTGNTGDLYSFGTTGSNERALGSINGGSTGNISYAVQLRNLSGGVITSLQISFTGEQWRNGGNVSGPDTVAFDYLITSSASNQIGSAGYTAVPALNFTNPISGNPAGPLDGNLPANQAFLSSLININLAPNDFIWLRWTDTPKSGNDHGLGIDNLTVTIPEPTSIAMVITAAAVIGLSYWRKKKVVQDIIIDTQ
ncbi:MAG TPA: PEP-CTERM sorting domain-containing protein [Gemmatales bacterium]|nr:PEP-CTERM sorting domain-containing protein [Gemmatales bacterium]